MECTCYTKSNGQRIDNEGCEIHGQDRDFAKMIRGSMPPAGACASA